MHLQLTYPALADTTKPGKILHLMSDDMQSKHDCNGHPMAQSPDVDALARAGVRYDRAYCPYSLCNPSPTSLWTGRHPTTTGVLDNITDFRAAHPDSTTLAEHFKKHGYVTLQADKIFHGGIDDELSWTEGAEIREKPSDYKTADRASTFPHVA